MKRYHFLYIFCNFTSIISALCSITYKSTKVHKQESFGSLEVFLLIFDDTKKLEERMMTQYCTVH